MDRRSFRKENYYFLFTHSLDNKNSCYTKNSPALWRGYFYMKKPTRPLPKLIVLLGPTSSGKSELGVLLAKKFRGEIISADSRQVYKGMDIGSGKITKKEMRGVPHHLLSVVAPKKIFTAEQYREEALKEVAGIARRKHIPFLVGGTPFYIKSITENLVLPAVPPNLRLRKKLEKKSAGELFMLLKKKDPRRAKTIDPHNKRRLIRALEIIEATKKSVPVLKKSAPQFDILILGLKRGSEELKKRIAKRLSARLRQGMVAEVKKLHEEELSWEKLESFGMEYRFVAKFLQQKISREQMISSIQKANEQYVKKQMMWWKNDPKIHWVESPIQASKLMKKFLQK